MPTTGNPRLATSSCELLPGRGCIAARQAPSDEKNEDLNSRLLGFSASAESESQLFRCHGYRRIMAKLSPKTVSYLVINGASLDLRLLRSRVLADLESGQLDKDDLCDASNELVEAASSFGMAAGTSCPICGNDRLHHVAYGFGKGLPASGQVIGGLLTSEAFERIEDLSLCIVEVCIECRWNFLIERLIAAEGDAGNGHPQDSNR